MTTQAADGSRAAGAKKGSGGFVGRVIIIALFAFTVFLYLRLIGAVPDPWEGAANVYQGASVATGVDNPPAASATNAAPTLRPVPAGQMRLIREVFAPETLSGNTAE